MINMSEEPSCLYQQFSPDDALAPYVECFWILQAPAHLSTGSERLPADGRTEILFHLAGPSKRYRADGQGEPHLQRTSSILGGRSHGYVVEQIGASHYVSVRFRPGGLAPFCHVPTTDLTDQIVDLDLIWGSATRTLEEQLFVAPSPQATAAILNKALLERFKDVPHLRQMQRAVQMIDQSGGNVSVRDLAEQLGWSQKHFERLFVQSMGFLPKHYARLSRFQQLCSWVTRHAHNTSMGKLAADFGYFDQSHLSKEITTFTGVSPRVFFSASNQIVEQVYVEPSLFDLSV